MEKYNKGANKSYLAMWLMRFIADECFEGGEVRRAARVYNPKPVPVQGSTGFTALVLSELIHLPRREAK